MKFACFLMLIAAFAFQQIDSSPIQEVQEIEPNFDAFTDVRLLLQNRANRANPVHVHGTLESINNSPYRRDLPLRVV